jgi:hypothetical protein
MSEPVHVHAPHEFNDPGRPTSGRERAWELVATVMLAAATLGIAWSGYQAARWSGLQSLRYAQASSARAQANRASTRAGQDRLQDLVNFNRWLEVSAQGDQTLADLYRRRFRPEFVPAFTAWLAQDPLHNPAAVASPLDLPQYHPAGFAQADRLERLADERLTQGEQSTTHTDDYVLTTVFFAAVLFFAGISLRFAWERLRVGVLVLGLVFLGYAVVRVGLLPIRL